MRTFIAIELPRALQDAIQHQITPLQQKVGRHAVRWVSVQNIHLTLKFLGEIHPNQVDQIKQILVQETHQITPFSLEIGGVGAFPNARQPRVLWVGMQAPAALRSLQRSLEAALNKVGYPAEDKAFSPHLTIGRVSQKATPAEIQTLRAAMEGLSIGPVGTVNIEALHLFKSDLQPSGPVYSRLFSAKFGV